MRLRIVIGLFAMGVLIVLIGPAGYGQFGGKGKGFGGTQPGGNPFGGMQFGGKGFGGGNRDPNQRFDQYAQGRSYFLISDASQMTQGLLAQYAQEKGVSFPNGQVTREQYLAFSDYVKAKFTPGMVVASSGQAPAPAAGDSAAPKAEQTLSITLEQLHQAADSEFKNLDKDGDNKLNEDEMPFPLRRDLARWDTNKDDFIDQNEYRNYFITRFQERMARNGNGPGASAVDTLLDGDIDKKPVVFRAGKLPAKGLPSWFIQLDTDADGQVALYEWRQAGKPLEEFAEWDYDNDGFITPEEALTQQAALSKSGNPLLANLSTGGQGFGGPRGFGQGFGGPRGFGGNNGPPGQGFGGFRGGNNGPQPGQGFGGFRGGFGGKKGGN
jgi:hypothetical protein